MDLGWIVAGVLALVCLWLVWVVEKAYATGINVGRIEAMEEEIAQSKLIKERLAKLRDERLAAERIGRA